MATRGVKSISQGCPSNCFLPAFSEFSRNRRKKFVFYARPQVDRNCFDLALFIINKACEQGIFNGWELYGVGHPTGGELLLPCGNKIMFLKNMPLEDYVKSLCSYDVALSLMATPHPSMPPIDLAMSGCIVVTNNCGCKDENALESICKNILSSNLNVEEMVDKLSRAVILSVNLKTRHNNALNANWPKCWDQVFGKEHLDWINNEVKFMYKNN